MRQKLAILSTDTYRPSPADLDDIAFLDRPLELEGGLSLSGEPVELLSGTDFDSEAAFQDVDMSLTVEDFPMFCSRFGRRTRGTIDIVDDNGIQANASHHYLRMRVRMADPQYAEGFGVVGRVQRDYKDGTDIGNANIWMVGGHFSVQQDAEDTSHTEEAFPVGILAKIENGSVGTVIGMNAQGQLGNSTGRDVTITKAVQTVGSTSYLIGRAGNTTTITEFAQLDLPAPVEAGTVNITNRYGIKQMDPLGVNLFEGKINYAGAPTSAAGLNSGDVWNDNGALKVVP